MAKAPKNKHIRKCQIAGCTEPASVYLISVPDKLGDFCPAHAQRIWSEYYKEWKSTTVIEAIKKSEKD